MTEIIKPFLASKITDYSKLKYPLWMSPKLDGIFVIISNGVVYSRSGKPIASDHVQETFGHKAYNNISGELIYGEPNAKDVFNKTTSFVRSRATPVGMDNKACKLYVFDYVNDVMQYVSRHKEAGELCINASYFNVPMYLVVQTCVNNEKEMLAMEQKYLDDGFEGGMLRDPNALYKHGRATEKSQALMKVKRFEDDEALIIGVEELMHNANVQTKGGYVMTEQPKEIVSLDYYKTNVGIFLRNMWGASYNGYNGTPYLNNYKFNGQCFPNILRGGNFFLLEGLQEITKCEKLRAATTKHNGYKLLDTLPPAVAASLKEFYPLAEVGQYWNEDIDQTEFTNKEFAAIRAMYKESYEDVPVYWYEVEIKHNLLGELTVTNYQEPEKMLVKVHQEDSFNTKIDTADLSTIVCYEDFERMLTPGFLLHIRPCSLTSDQVYKIIRAYVKENINPRNAQITSDYDFCFTVKRKIKHVPVTTKREIKKANGRSYASPKFKTNTETSKLVELFEMTSASNHYNGYTVIQGWQADNLVDMQEQVKYYLDTLMGEINKDVNECPHCHGVGAIVNKIGTNERDN